MISSNKFIPVAEPDLSGNELKYLTKCIQSNWISSKGKFIDTFEKMYAAYIGTKYAMACANGTVALHLALMALGIRKGDQVIVPDLTFVASANSVTYTQAEPVLVDVNRKTWNIDTSQIKKEITKKTKAIMAVHLYGNPSQMEEIMKIAKENKILVVEDAAEAHGAEVKVTGPAAQVSQGRASSRSDSRRNSPFGEAPHETPPSRHPSDKNRHKWRKVGSIGDVGCFSFYGNKIITTGEGGMVTTNSKKLYEKMRILRDHGQTPGKSYYHEVIGFNYRMTNMQAAVGVAQMERIDRFIEKKRSIASKYNKYLENISGISPPHMDKNIKNVYWLYSIIVDRPYPLTRDELMNTMKKEAIETRPFFHPLHRLPPYRKDESYRNATYLSAHGLSLPSSTRLHDKDIIKVANVIKKNNSTNK